MSAATRNGAEARRRTRTLPDGPGTLGEFGLIARDLAPLAGDGARGLTDDVALFAGHAVTTDTIARGVHVLPDDPLDTVARKAVRVNVSDLVAKGCQPVAMTLASAWGADATPGDHAAFARGLADDLARYGIGLLGGDTTRLPPGSGPVFTVAMFGRPLGDAVPSRAGADAGDVLFVSGTIGDGGLGLWQLTGRWDAGGHADAVTAAYRTPDPPAGAAAAIARYAKASLDVSDGLLADAGHLAARSGVGVRIAADALPLSPAGQAYVGGGGALADLAAAGDDYQALVAVAPDDADAFARGTGFARIGTCVDGEGVRLIAGDGTDRTPRRTGYRHF